MLQFLELGTLKYMWEFVAATIYAISIFIISDKPINIFERTADFIGHLNYIV